MATDTNWGDRLGQILMQGSQDYANIKIADDRDALARQRTLEDRAAADAMEESRFQRGNAAEESRFERGIKADRETARLASDESFQKSMLSVLVQNRFLAPGDVGNPQKVAEAYARAEQAGLIERYQTLITSGLLKAEDIADPAKVQAALNKLGEKTVSTTASAQTEIDRLRDEAIRIETEKTELDNQLAMPAHQPTNAEILSRAYQMAKAANPKLTDADLQPKIQEYAQSAVEDLTNAATLKKYQDDTAAKTRLVGLDNSANTIRQAMAVQTNAFKVAPGVRATPTTVAPAPTTAAPRAATAAESASAFISALKAAGMAGPQGGEAPPPPAPGAFSNTFNDPELIAANERANAEALASRLRPIQQAREIAARNVTETQAAINQLKANPGAPPPQQFTTLTGEPIPQRPNDRVVNLNRLYTQLQQSQKQLAATDEQIKQLTTVQNAAKQGTVPVPVKTTPFSDPVFAPPPQTPVTPGFDSRLTLQPAM